jgi:excisionase family DNA binding protein
MTVDQVAAYLQLNRLTVYRYVREGRIPAARIGKVYRLLKADVDRFLEAQKGAPWKGGHAVGAASDRPGVRSVWVRDIKKAEEISVRPPRREERKVWDSVILSGEPLDVIIRGLH